MPYKFTQKCGICSNTTLYYCTMKIELRILLNSIKTIMSYSEAQKSLNEEVIEKAKKEWSELDQILSNHYKNELLQ